MNDWMEAAIIAVNGAQLILESRILAVADVFDALSARRPYRNSIPREKVLAILRKWSPHVLDATCLEALEQSGMEFDQTFKGLPTPDNQPVRSANCSSIDCTHPKSNSAVAGR